MKQFIQVHKVHTDQVRKGKNGKLAATISIVQTDMRQICGRYAADMRTICKTICILHNRLRVMFIEEKKRRKEKLPTSFHWIGRGSWERHSLPHWAFLRRYHYSSWCGERPEERREGQKKKSIPSRKKGRKRPNPLPVSIFIILRGRLTPTRPKPLPINRSFGL